MIIKRDIILQLFFYVDASTYDRFEFILFVNGGQLCVIQPLYIYSCSSMASDMIAE